jgi:hypothetical protein
MSGSDGPWDVTRRYRKYEQSLKSGTVAARGDGDTQAQYLHYRESRERMRARNNQVRQLLFERELPMCSFAAYCNYARHLGSVCGEYQAATLRHLVYMALDRWCAKGLDREVLLVIAEEVFGLRLGT